MSSPDVSQPAKPQANWLAQGLTIALVTYWVALFTATHVPINPEIVVPGNDKTLHFAGYGLLALLFGTVLGLRRDPSLTVGALKRIPLGRAAMLLVLYSAVDELTQPLVGRHCDLWDAAADFGGMLIGLAIAVPCLACWTASQKSPRPRCGGKG